MNELDKEYPFKTNQSAYDIKKEKVMSESEREEAKEFLRWYRSGHGDKEARGLFDKWEMIDLYWEGEAHPPESDSDPGSNTNIVNPNVEGQVGYLVEQNIAITATPRGASDVPFANRARITMEFVKDQNKLKRKLDVHERRRKKYGTGIFRVLFDPDCLDGMGLPIIKTCHPAYVFFDPAVTDIYEIQEGRFALEGVNKSLAFARDNFNEELVDAIQPGYHPMEAEFLFGEEDGDTDEISHDSYLHMFIFTRYWKKSTNEEGKKTKELRLRLIQMSGCGVILSDTKKQEEEDETGEAIFPSTLYPYFATPDMARDGTVWAKSSSELLTNTQDLIDDLDDQIRINARMTGNVQKIIGANSGIDPDKWTNEPGLNVTADSVEDWKLVQPSAMPQYVINRRNQAFQERQIQTRFSDQMNGVKQEGVDTATESLSLQQGGSQGINHSKLLLEETMADMFAYCFELCMYYWDEQEFFEVTEKPGEFDFFRPSDMLNIPQLIPANESYKTNFLKTMPNSEAAPKYMPLTDEKGEAITKKIALNVTVSVGAGLPSNKAFVYNLIKEARRDKAISLQEYRKLIREYAGLPVEENLPPELMMELGIQGPMAPGQVPNANVQGLTQGGAPALRGVI